MTKEETVEVTIKVPKKPMKILEAEDYFGWQKNHFWIAAIKDCISCELSEMDSDEISKLKEKYGEEIDQAASVRIVELKKVVA